MKCFVFLTRRPRHDVQTWPVVFNNLEMATEHPFRVSEIVEIELTENSTADTKVKP